MARGFLRVRGKHSVGGGGGGFTSSSVSYLKVSVVHVYTFPNDYSIHHEFGSVVVLISVSIRGKS